MKLPQSDEVLNWTIAAALLVLIVCLIALVGSFAWLALTGGLSTTTTVTVTP